MNFDSPSNIANMFILDVWKSVAKPENNYAVVNDLDKILTQAEQYIAELFSGASGYGGRPTKKHLRI